MTLTEQAIILSLQVVFATWYVAYAISSTHGPLGVFDSVRAKTTLGGLLTCPVCLAPWVALILLVAPYGIVIQALAIAGLAMLLHSASGWRFGHE